MLGAVVVDVGFDYDFAFDFAFADFAFVGFAFDFPFDFATVFDPLRFGLYAGHRNQSCRGVQAIATAH